jgi:hypothetical protein
MDDRYFLFAFFLQQYNLLHERFTEVNYVPFSESVKMAGLANDISFLNRDEKIRKF